MRKDYVVWQDEQSTLNQGGGYISKIEWFVSSLTYVVLQDCMSHLPLKVTMSLGQIQPKENSLLPVARPMPLSLSGATGISAVPWFSDSGTQTRKVFLDLVRSLPSYMAGLSLRSLLSKCDCWASISVAGLKHTAVLGTRLLSESNDHTPQVRLFCASCENTIDIIPYSGI